LSVMKEIIIQMNSSNIKELSIIRLVTRNKVDGLIILVEEVHPESLSYLVDYAVPFVCLHYPPGQEIKDQEVVYTDHYMGGKLVAEHLLEKGLKSFCMLAMEEKHLEFQLREEGYRDTIEKAGFVVKQFFSDSTFDSSRAVISQHAQELRECDAMFASNDLMGLGAIRAMKDHGFTIPDDMAVVGYDDSEFGRYSSPGLTSIHQPREELAHISCDRLFIQMEKRKNGEEIMKKRISIQPVLIPRESS
jgi:LacI family transcriptional regulator